MRRYRQPEPGRRSWGLLFGKIVALDRGRGALLAGGLAGGTYLYVEQDIAASLGPHSAD